ncbi:MAG: class I tRNA ligase family protein [Chitinivibrionales bacterium]|nr:class I tRNA ligase family protein [Chitinivibrionales bacterium]
MNTSGDKRGDLTLLDTLSGGKKRFEPRSGGRRVLMFTCGPSVYKPQHLGNYRTFLYEDVLERYLDFLGYAVTREINYTDVEDKAIAEMRRRGLSLEELTEPIEARFREDCRRLHIRLPDFIPRSSTSVDTAAHMTAVLMDKGNAYRHRGDIFFDPLTYPGFGQVFGLDMSKWPREKRRFRKDTYRGRRWNLGDFVLWHAATGDDPVAWDSEVGRGRPAWNIQDAAMILKHLGPAIDIKCGGIDNLYRHHDYTRAIMESYSGREFARYWLHGEHLLVDGDKMSKSKGNVVYVSDLLDRGLSPEDIRFFLIDHHYRAKRNLTDATLDRARIRHGRLLDIVAGLDEHAPETNGTDCTGELLASFSRAMNDDLNVPAAIDTLTAQLEHFARLCREHAESRPSRTSVMHALDQIDSVLCVGLRSRVPQRIDD